MIQRMKRRRQAGDTIVEVLIVLAVLSLAFAISYATANRGLNQSRNAEEHSQALGVLNAQVELLRQTIVKDGSALQQAITAGNITANHSFCIANNDVSQPSSFVTVSDVNDLTDSDASKYPAACIKNSFYHVSVTPQPSTTSGSVTTQSYFDFKVLWPGIGNLGTQQEEITYRIQPSAATAFSAPALLPVSPTIAVTVQKIAPVTDGSGKLTGATPSCSSSDVSNFDVPLVKLAHPAAQVDNQSSPTTGGIATFSQLSNDSGTYSVSLNLPAGYSACDASKTVSVAPGKTSSVTMKVYASCSAHISSTPGPTTYSRGSIVFTNKEYALLYPAPLPGGTTNDFFGHEPLDFFGPVYSYHLKSYASSFFGPQPVYDVYSANASTSTITVTNYTCP